MKNKENKRSKSKEDRNRSASFDRTQKKSNFSSIIFQSGRNSLCSPKDTRPSFDKYNTYMQYISSGRFIPDNTNSRQINILNRPKASTPTPRRLSVTLLQQGRKSVTMRENPLRDLSRNQRVESPKSKNKSLFVKGSNLIKPKKQQLKKKESVKGNGFEKKKKSSTKVQIKRQSKEEEKLQQKQKKLIEKLFVNIEFHRNLGRGAHALVRSGIDFTNKRKIAVKVYEKQKLSEQETMSIYNQVQILGSLNHPTIIKLYEIIETFKTINLVMQYGGGNTLQQYIRNRNKGRLDQCQARTIFRSVTSGISYIHESGVAHRDIKTQNILLNKYLQVKIIDFGFSQKNNKKELSTVFCGTPTYMPPQIITKIPHSPFIADCWSLGILLYNMLHGHCPFKAQNQKQLFQKINDEEIQIEQHVGCQARDLLNKLLCKTAANRMSSQQILSHPWLKIQ